MLFTIGAVAGLLAGLALLGLTAKHANSGWVALVLGLGSAALFAVTVFPGHDSDLFIGPASIPLSIGIEAAAIAFGAGALARGERRLTNWLGFVLALGPALFWVVFVIGEFFAPAH